MTGHADRPYTALQLPGRFYTPTGRAPTCAPHLEISARTFTSPDPAFPDRLALAGNGLHFPWWVTAEVLAVKRCVLAPGAGDIGPLVDVLTPRRAALAAALRPLVDAAASRWEDLERLHQGQPKDLSATVTAPFSADEVSAYLPAARDLGLSVEFDSRLADSARGWASRRVGVWQVRGQGPGGAYSLGVLTPRLTRSSTLTDPLFDPDKEAAAALLVRGLLLTRVLRQHLSHDAATIVTDPAPPPALRIAVARPGEAVPRASVASAVAFLQRYPDPASAWQVLTEWAHGIGGAPPRAVLTVGVEQFTAAHKAAARAVRRAEEPVRDDIDTILPLAWDNQNRVVRLTYARTRTASGPLPT